MKGRDNYFSVSERKERGDPPVGMQLGSIRSWLDFIKVKVSVFTLNAYEIPGRSLAVSRDRLI